VDDQDRESNIALWIVLILAITIALAVTIGTAISKRGAAAKGAPAAATTGAAAIGQLAARTPSLGAISIVRADDKVTLRGEVRDEKTKERLLSKAKLVFGDSNVIDALVINASAPELWWKARPLDVMSRLKSLPAFSLVLRGNEATLEGTVGSEETKASVAKYLSDNLVDRLNLTNNLKWDGAIRAVEIDPSVLLAENIEFDTGSAVIPDNYRVRLNLIAVAIVEDGYRLRIVGHTDNTGTPDANLKLSRDRAESVVTYLEFRGVPAGSLSAEGMGQSKPIASNETAEGRQHNRRIEFVQ